MATSFDKEMAQYSNGDQDLASHFERENYVENEKH
eukprot:CAMPEP_0170501512 /NCGR_PEP_ID=MMETSP0208-20121228/38529_1 /TAXON_ID=197538 /ORGANISM="Strombidium inclinatum, Strain S3" /LENGTH=34 /DNA_ID= /DNA_START= /DNA_END= /DNA_ORIENTATION=